MSITWITDFLHSTQQFSFIRLETGFLYIGGMGSKWWFMPLIFCFCLISGQSIFGQSTDTELLKNHIQQKSAETVWHQGHFHPTKNPFKFLIQGVLWVYQKEITYQLYPHCIYETSCSEFSRQAFSQTNPIRASLMTLDRLSRCNGIESMRMHKQGVLSKNKRFFDPPALYFPYAD